MQQAVRRRKAIVGLAAANQKHQCSVGRKRQLRERIVVTSGADDICVCQGKDRVGCSIRGVSVSHVVQIRGWRG